MQSIITASMVSFKPVTYDKSYVYPRWANAVGWLIVASSALLIPAYAVYRVCIITSHALINIILFILAFVAVCKFNLTNIKLIRTNYRPYILELKAKFSLILHL